MAISDIGDFNKVTFVDDSAAVPISAANLNAVENRLQDIDDALSGPICFIGSASVGVNTATQFTKAKLSVLTDSDSMAFVGGTMLTDATAKACRIGGAHYTNAEEPVGICFSNSDGTDNFVNLGGGTNQANAATLVRIYTAANATTVTGSERLRVDSSGNMGLGATSFGTNAVGVLGIGNGTPPTTSPANMIQIYSKDSSVGSTNSTLAIRTEQAVESIGTFTPSHKLRVWINEVEYWLQLDAV